MIKQLAHLCINSRDLQATETFYCNVLGCRKAFDFIRNDRLFGFYIDFGNRTFLEVFEGDPGEEGTIRHLALEVEDLEGMIRTAEEHGVEVGTKKMGSDQTWQVWIEDPNGVKIELQEYTENSRQLRGGVCEVSW